MFPRPWIWLDLIWKGAKTLLTGFESDFADEHPRCVEVEADADEAPDEVRQSDDDVACEVDEVVATMVADDRSDGRQSREVRGAYTGSNDGASKHPHVPREHVVAVKSQSSEPPRTLELEDDRDRVRPGRRRAAVVAPADPLVALPPPTFRVQTQVRMTLHAVGELAETAAQVVIGDATVVGEVAKVDVRCAMISLRHTVRQHSIYTHDTRHSVLRPF